MTVQVVTAIFARSKLTLAAALKDDPASVTFYDPSIFAGSRGHFTGADIQVNEKFPVVMDHPKRSRFAVVLRGPKGYAVL